MGALAPRSPPPHGSTTGYRLMVQVLAHTENNILILTSSISGTVSGNRLGYGVVYLEIGGGTWVQGERGRGGERLVLGLKKIASFHTIFQQSPYYIVHDFQLVIHVFCLVQSYNVLVSAGQQVSVFSPDCSTRGAPQLCNF